MAPTVTTALLREGCQDSTTGTNPALPRERYYSTLRICALRGILSPVAATPNLAHIGTRSRDKIQDKGNEPVIDIHNMSTSSRRATNRTKIALDLLTLFVTLACLGFALYRSWH